MAAGDTAVGYDHDTHTGVEGNERRTKIVIAITVVVMLAELAVGMWSGSLALTADGWHMATHAGALGMSAVAYWFARTHADKHAFAFGTGKVYALAGFSSAVLLAVAAVWMAVEAVTRLVVPHDVRFDEALPVAVLGLVVNLVSIRLLHGGPGHVHDHAAEAPHARDDHDHGHDHDHDHSHDHAPVAEGRPRPAQHDHNLRAVYLHVLADALTSVFAIAALACGRYLGWVVLDPLMALFGGALILRWSVGLGREAAAQLVDATRDVGLERRVAAVVAGFSDARVVDLHTWRTGPQHRACIVVVACGAGTTAGALRAAILGAATIEHLTVEVHCAASSRADG